MPSRKSPFEERDWTSVALALLVVGGIIGAVLMFGPRSVKEPTDMAAVPPVSSQSPSTIRPLDSPVQGVPEMRKQVPNTAFDDTARRQEQRRRLASLKQICDHWTRKNTQGQYEALQRSACSDMQRLAASLGESTHVVIRQAPSLQRPARPPGKLIARADECTRFREGSIDYRRCRARAKDKLANACSHYRRELYVSTGSDRQRVRDLEAAWCEAYNSYQVVR